MGAYTGTIKSKYGTIEYDFSKVGNIPDRVLDDETYLYAHDLLYRLVDEYVPYREGVLSRAVEILPEYLRYISVYAHYQYTGDDFNFAADLHPLATAEWDKVAMQTKLAQFESEMTAYLLERIRRTYDD